ncbi:MAG TPA: peptidoglycan-associated lipoprotein Pal [Candidatus Binatia bacterium]|nr:peptidoglycan-associated lipoprotein Pal [Candidatus Binatia bacterium]
MAALNRLVRCGLVVILLAGAGCAPTTAKPEPDATSSTPDKSAAQRPGEGQRGATRESTTPGQSSLDQLREGKPTVTPASSPLKDIYFSFDRYDLEGEARATLKANADWLKRNPAARVEIEGHCDERGTNEYNLALGAKRAQAAKDYLVSLGISTERLSTISYGEEIPVCKEPSENCWGQNRRARFVIIQARPAS